MILPFILACLFGLFSLYLCLWTIPVHRLKQENRANTKGKVVLITGGAMGIGKELARKFLTLGAKVVLWDVQKRKLQATVQELKDQCPECKVNGYVCDVASKEQIKHTAALVKKEVGDVDILINNAGVVFGRSILELDDEEIERTIQVNYVSNFFTVRSFLGDMLDKNSGHVVTISSVAGLVGATKLSDYCSTKAASASFTESLRMELKLRQQKRSDGKKRGRGRGVKTLLVCPYQIDTGMFGGVELKAWWLKLPFLVGQVLHSESVAEAILHAILVEKEVLILPSIFSFIPLLRSLTPTALFDGLQFVTGSASAMDSFVGRGSDFGFGIQLEG